MRPNNGLLMLLLSALALCACATPITPPASVPVVVDCPKPAPAPADVMVERPANFRSRLLSIFSASPTTPTALPSSSARVSE